VPSESATALGDTLSAAAPWLAKAHNEIKTQEANARALNAVCQAIELFFMSLSGLLVVDRNRWKVGNQQGCWTGWRNAAAAFEKFF
jgi:hypothetical protein